MRIPLLGALVLLALHTSASATHSIVRASSAGGHLDTDLMRGGGSDDTVVFQRLLDGATKGKPVHLIIDGPALVSGLNSLRQYHHRVLRGWRPLPQG
jgi:hypothetical protein